jgi:acyl-CoA thioesterase-1
MKNIVSLFCIIGLMGFLTLNGCDNGSIGGNTGASVVCLGDSLTAGYGAAHPGVDDKTKSYPAYLQNKINIPVVNAGISGNTTAMALSRVNADVLIKDPLIVIIELGANDLFQGISLADTKNNLQKIIDSINDGNRKIYVAKFYTEEVARAMANELDIGSYAMQTLLITQYNAMFNALASSNDVELIEDIWSGVWGIHMSDAVHPNAAGYEIMADNYYKVMEPYLRANSLVK